MPAHLPRYYTPKGIDVPAHCPHLGGSALVEGVGPDVDNRPRKRRKVRGGGTVYGGPYTIGEPGWIETPEGWWFNLGGCLPTHTARLETSPRVVRWAQVAGARADHWWRVPVILQPDGDASRPDALYVSALDRVWTGGEKYADPAEIAALQRRVLEVLYRVARSKSNAPHRDAIGDLVCDLLAVGHHVSRHEIIAGGWLTEAVELRVLIATADVPIGTDSAR